MFPNFTWILKNVRIYCIPIVNCRSCRIRLNCPLNQLVAQCSSFLLRFPLSAAKLKLFYPTVVAFQQMFSIGKHIFWLLKVAYCHTWCQSARYIFKFNHVVIVTHFTGSLWQFIPMKLSHEVGNLFGINWNQWKTPAGFLLMNISFFS